MIVCNALNLVYIDVPKTGSKTIEHILKSKYKGIHIRNNLGGQGGHRRIVPEDYKEYTRLVTVRNPYTRALSHWHYNKENKNLYSVTNRLGFKNVDSFDDFLDFLLFINKYDSTELTHNICGWFSCSKFLSLCGFDIVLKTEKLNEMFNDLWFVEKKVGLPVTNKSQNKSFNYSKKQQDKIIEWAGDDFDLFNYRK
jgi:hypothetical protein